MVLPALDKHTLLRRAFVASLVLHLVLAVFFPKWTQHLSSQGPVESISFARIAHVHIEHPARRAQPPAAPRTTHHAASVQSANIPSELTANRPKPHAPPKPRKGTPGHVTTAPRNLNVSNVAVAPVATGVPAAVTSQPSVAPTTPSPLASSGQRIAQSYGSSDRGGVLPLGAEQDPVLDPTVRAQLAKRFNVHVTLIVTVGDDGKTKRVVFQPPLDAQTERAIESVLADANWDAAVCGGGINCEGTATIKL